MRKGFLALLMCMVMVSCAVTQPSAVIASIEQAYRQLDYDGAERSARQALENYNEYTVDQLTDIHTFLALIAYNRGEMGEARRQFLSALQLSPYLELDPVLVPPKIQDFFGEIRDEAAAEQDGAATATPRYVLVRDPRADAALRSMVIPGWGQLYKGHEVKGFVFAGIFAAALGGSVLAHTQRADAEARYRDASTIEEANRRYDTYNAWHRARNGFIQGAAIVWAVSYVDALLTSTSVAPARSLSLNATPSHFSLTVRF